MVSVGDAFLCKQEFLASRWAPRTDTLPLPVIAAMSFLFTPRRFGTPHHLLSGQSWEPWCAWGLLGLALGD